MLECGHCWGYHERHKETEGDSADTNNVKSKAMADNFFELSYILFQRVLQDFGSREGPSLSKEQFIIKYNS